MLHIPYFCIIRKEIFLEFILFFFFCQKIQNVISSFIMIFFLSPGRTFPTHPYFMQTLGPGQLALFNVLKAYSLLDSDVGYCQGLSFVGGVLLLHVSNIFFFLFTDMLSCHPVYFLILNHLRESRCLVS